MGSPFPGMDPYLEGYLWPDVHSRLAIAISEILAPQISPKYVDLLEIDLLRRGTRPFAHPMVPQAHYLISLLRAGKRRTDIWAVDVKDKLPVVPVPLREPDPDVTLDLGLALRTIYERSLYQLSINYEEAPPPPEFSPEDQAWLRERVGAHEGR